MTLIVMRRNYDVNSNDLVMGIWIFFLIPSTFLYFTNVLEFLQEEKTYWRV